MERTQVEEQIQRLKYGNYLVRCDAVSMLGHIGDASAVPALIEALKETGYFVRRSAVEALIKNIGRAAVDALIDAQSNRDSFVRTGAAIALGRIGDAAAVPALSILLRDKDSSVQLEAARALGRIGIAAVPALITSSKKSDDCSRYYSMSALWSIGDSVALPRKILASTRWPAQRRAAILDALRDSRYNSKDITIHYSFLGTRDLCLTILTEKAGDFEIREGAQTVLNWLDGDRDLLIASDADTGTPPEDLLRPIRETSDLRPHSLLRGSNEPKDIDMHVPKRHALRERVFRKRTNAAR